VKVVVDGRTIRSEADLHAALAGPLDFGPYYGWNLNALWDRLSTDVERPVELVWEHADASREGLGAELFDRISTVLLRAAAEDERYGWEQRFTVRVVGGVGDGDGERGGARGTATAS
jgi:ribonuclease inhibitor